MKAELKLYLDEQFGLKVGGLKSCMKKKNKFVPTREVGQYTFSEAYDAANIALAMVNSYFSEAQLLSMENELMKISTSVVKREGHYSIVLKYR